MSREDHISASMDSRCTPDEFTSLLSKPVDSDAGSESESEENGIVTRLSSRRLVFVEFSILLKGSGPVVLAYTLQNSLLAVSVLIIGRSSPENLAACAFSQMFAMVTAFMVALGGTTAIDTLASSTFTGSSNKHDLGVLLQRGFLVLGIFYIPVAILWACSEPVFRLLGQDPRLSHESARFLTCFIPGGLGYIYFELMKKYLQAQGIMRAGTYALMITSPLNAIFNYLLCYTFGIGLLGVPIALSLTLWLSFALLVLYARFIAGSDCWGGWSRDAFQNLGTFARLAALGFVHVGTEWWAFEIVALAAGRLGTIPLAAQSVIMTADQVLTTIPFGIGIASSARVGNLLGLRNGRGAAYAARSSAILAMITGSIVLLILMTSRNHFAKIFNDDARVVRLTAEVLPYVALFQIADGLNGSCGGSLRGMGRQHVGALVNIACYYCCALPLGIWLAFHGWELQGLWIGQCVALYLVGILEWVIVARSQWDVEVYKAFQRMDSQERAERAERAESGNHEE